MELGLYCTDVAQRRSTKLCRMFDGRLLGWYIMYTFLGALAPNGIHFASKSCVILYRQRYCTALEQRPSAKLCGVVQGMELRNFRKGATYILLGGHHVGHRPTL